MRALAGDPRSIPTSGAKAGDTAEVCARGKSKIGKLKKNVSPLDSDVFPASHEGRRDAVCCQSLFFNWLPCVDHWTVPHWTAEAAVAAVVSLQPPFSLPIRPDSLASVT